MYTKNFSISISSYLFWQSLLIYTVIISVLLFFGWIDQDTNNWNQTQYIRKKVKRDSEENKIKCIGYGKEQMAALMPSLPPIIWNKNVKKALKKLSKRKDIISLKLNNYFFFINY